MREMKDSGVEWLGEVPAEWDVVPGKRILMLLQRPVEDGDGVVTCFRDGEVTLRANRRTEGFTIALKEIGYQGVEPGDLVVHGMDGFAGSIGISDSRGKASPVLNVMDSDQNKRFLMYYMRGLAYRDVYMALSDGIRVRSCNLSWKKIGNLPFALPPLPVQRRIADYLDEKCAEIDRAVSAAERSIEELNLYRSARLEEVITRVSHEAPREKLKYVLKESKDKSPDGIGEPLSITIARGVLRSAELSIPNPTSSLVGAKIVHAGDLVFNKLKAYYGVMYVSPYNGLISPEYAVYRAIDMGRTSLKYLEYVFHTAAMIDEFIIRISGVADGFRRLYTSDLFDIAVPVPSIEVQQGIVAELDDLYASIFESTEAKQAIIADLKAYKQSLIYEVVTGKREV